MPSTTPLSFFPQPHRSPLNVFTTWARSRFSKSCNHSTSSSPSSSISDSLNGKVRGEQIRFKGPDSIEEDGGAELEEKYLKGLLKRGVHVRKVKITYDSRFCEILARYHADTVEELIIECRKAESLNKFLGAIPLFTNLRSLEIKLETATLRHDTTIPGLARITAMPNITTLRLDGWNRDLWTCLGRACTKLTTLRIIDLQGTYQGRRQCDIMQTLIDNSQSTLNCLRVSLGYETGLNLQSLHNLTKVVISVPRSDKRDEEDEGMATHEMIPTSGHLVLSKILDQQLLDGGIVTEAPRGAKDIEIDTALA